MRRVAIASYGVICQILLYLDRLSTLVQWCWPLSALSVSLFRGARWAGVDVVTSDCSKQLWNMKST